MQSSFESGREMLLAGLTAEMNQAVGSYRRQEATLVKTGVRWEKVLRARMVLEGRVSAPSAGQIAEALLQRVQHARSDDAA